MIIIHSVGGQLEGKSHCWELLKVEMVHPATLMRPDSKKACTAISMVCRNWATDWIWSDKGLHRTTTSSSRGQHMYLCHIGSLLAAGPCHAHPQRYVVRDVLNASVALGDLHRGGRVILDDQVSPVACRQLVPCSTWQPVMAAE